jgi:hypothetical protein
MKRLRITIGLAVVMALALATAPAFAAKEPLKFGEFEASIVGKTITPSTPAPVSLWKEGSASVTKLKIGGVSFGFNVKEAKPEPEKPCNASPKVKGYAKEEKSKSLLLDVTFKKCVSYVKGGNGFGYKSTNFKLGMRFIANESAEIGSTEGGMEIMENALVKVANANKDCKVVIPQQFVPSKSGENPEKFWEAAEYETEKEAPVENWEKSKKLQEQYPGNFKNRLFIETTEKFRHITAYVDTRPTNKPHGCVPVKGEENSHLVTDEKSPWFGWTEHTDGSIGLELEGLEIKGGQLGFVPPV